MEIWKNIEGYEGYYQISNIGNVFNIKNNKLLKQYNNRGYKVVSLCKNGKSINKQVHRLVAEAFIPNPYNKSQVDHILPISLGGTCEVSNLRWVTPKENMNNPYTLEALRKGHEKKEYAPVKIPIAQISDNGDIIRVFGSCKEMYEELGDDAIFYEFITL